MSVKDDGGITVLPNVFKSLQGYFVVRYGHTNKDVCMQEVGHIFRENGVHETCLLFQAVVLIHELQLDHVPLVRPVPNVTRIDVGVRCKNFQHPAVVSLAHMGNRVHCAILAKQPGQPDGRQGHRGVQETPGIVRYGDGQTHDSERITV